MAGYREISVATDTRPRRPVRTVRPVGPAGWETGWRGVLAKCASEAILFGREKPGSAFGAFVAVVAAGFVCFNALGHQKGRHPAPILPKVAAKAPAAPAPVARQQPAREAVTDPPREAKADPAPAPKQAARDVIGDLIRAEDTTASVTPKVKSQAQPVKAVPAKPEAAPADQAVLRVQRALAKLGYGPVKADGAMGPATKAAIEKFERDRKLPVTGEAAGRTLRTLESTAAKG